jgi:DEAD/DEAH box helicase domain-containing protein
VWAGRGYPAHGIGLRSGSSSEYRIARDDGTLVGTVDEGRAFELVHPGAVYLHQGTSYLVTELDLDDHAAIVEPCAGDEFTMAKTDTEVHVTAVDAERRVGLARLHVGSVEITSRVVGYQRKDATTGEVLGSAPLDLPASCLATRAFWYVLDADVLVDAGLSVDRWPGTLHAVEHAAIGILPLFAICDRWDVGGVSTVRQAETGGPTIVIYDGYPGGAGVAELGYGAADRHLGATLEVITECRCLTGCPSCVQSPKCGNWNEPLDKAGAAALLGLVLDRHDG